MHLQTMKDSPTEAREAPTKVKDLPTTTQVSTDRRSGWTSSDEGLTPELRKHTDSYETPLKKWFARRFLLVSEIFIYNSA